MQFIRRAPGRPRRLAVFPGAFHPPTKAHMELARRALARADEVLFVLPRIQPHKRYDEVGLEDRCRMVELAAAETPQYSVGISEHGLFIDLARECRPLYDPLERLFILCGRDAAERAINWDYGRPGAFREMLNEFEMLVGSRGGEFVPPPSLEHRIHTLAMPPEYDEVSSTEVRERIRRGQAWEHLVPEVLIPLVRELYAAHKQS